MAHAAIRDYLRAAAGTTPGGAADIDLIARFAATGDEAAFELLLWRHAALVQRVCRAVLGDHHDAEDAAQATFLALARKAHTLDGRGSVVGWLYRVARRVSMRLAKKRQRLPRAAELDQLPATTADVELSPDEASAVCEEIDRLPERYRVPVLLCFFEGLTHAEAARRVGWPIGTLAGRLARAKDLLARRLSRRGVGVASVVLGVPAGSFVGATARAAVPFAAGRVVVPDVETSVLTLAEGTVRAMTIPVWKLTAAAAALVCTITAGVWGFTPQKQPPATPAPQAKPADPKPADTKPADGNRVADAVQRIKSQNNLKQILIAMHSYHDTFGHFPKNVTDKNGKPLLSWRVEILPFIEQTDLYKEFKRDEPWDSEHNKKLLAKMPAVYRVGFEPKDSTTTYYQGFAGPKTVFEPGVRLKITSITDGTSNTLAVVEAGPPVEWTKPADIPYDPKKPLPKLDGPFTNVLVTATADGASQLLRRDFDEKAFRLLIERDDGTPVSFDKLHAVFALSAEERKIAQDLLKENERLFTALAEQLRERQKLLEELVKNQKADRPIKGVDLEHLMQMNKELERALGHFKKETEELRKEAGKK